MLMRKLNLTIEALFNAAMREKRIPLFLVNLFSAFSPTFRGIWLFRKGDISDSLRALRKSRTKLDVVHRCIARSEYILAQLDNTESEAPSRQHTAYNARVLMAVHSNGHFYPNGYAVRTAMITKALSEKGVHISAVTRPGYPWDLAKTAERPVVPFSEYEGLSYKHTFDSRNGITGPEDVYIERYCDVLTEAAKTHNATVVHAHSSYINGLAAAKASRKLGIKSIYEMRGLWHLSRAVKEPLFENTEHFRYCAAMEVNAAKSCDQVVTLNQALRVWLIEQGVRADKIHVVPNGAIGGRLHRNASPSTSFKLGFFGSITRYEGLDDCIKAVEICLKAGSELTLEIYGQGEFLPSLRNMVNKLNLGKYVIFKGHVDRESLSRAYQEVDAVLITRKDLPVTRLVTPLKLVEAMLMGKACIVSDLPALTEVASDRTTALLTIPGQAQSIADVITQLIASPELIRDLGEAAHHTATERYDWQVSLNTYLKLYKGS